MMNMRRATIAALIVLLAAGAALAGPAQMAGTLGSPLAASASTDRIKTFWQTFKDDLFLGLPSRAGSIAANQATQTVAQDVEPVLINAVSRVISPSVAGLTVPALTEGLGLMTSQAGWVAASNLYRTKALGKAPEKLDLLDIGSSAAAAVLGGRLVSAFIPGSVGKWVGQWFFWQLASSAVQLRHSGQKVTAAAVLRAMNLPKMTLQMVGTEGMALLGKKVVARAILSMMPGGEVWGAFVTTAVQLVMASVGNAFATAFYESFLASDPPSASSTTSVVAIRPGMPVVTIQGHQAAPGATTAPASAAQTMRQAYENFLEVSAQDGASDTRTVDAYATYATARATYDATRAKALAGQ